MTTLAAAVSIGDNQLIINAPMAAGSFPGWVKIDNELLNVGGEHFRTGTTLVLSEPATATHDSGATVTYAGRPYDANFLAATGGGGAEVTIYSRTVTLINAQVKALPTTAVEIVPAPSASQIIAPIAAWLYVDWTADYTNIGDEARIGLGYTGTLSSALSEFSGGQASNLLADGASHVAFTGTRGKYPGFGGVTLGVGQFVDEPGIVGAGIEIYAANAGSATGNFTGGDPGTSITVTVWHGLVDLA